MTGALALLGDNSLTITDISRPYLRQQLDHEYELAILEEIHPRPFQDVSSTGKLMFISGLIEGLLIGLGKSYVKVNPKTWRESFQLPPRKSKAERKRDNLRKARELWPECLDFSREKDHNRADAALLALYGQRLLMLFLFPLFIKIF